MAEHRKIAVIGLGYVGLPVAVAFGQLDDVIAFDVNTQRIAELKKGVDVTNEVSTDALQQARITFTLDKNLLQQADFFIVTVPTPLDGAHKPDLSYLFQACETIGSQLKKDDIVVFESTVYPGTTQEECMVRLERASKLKAGVDFSVGYSPERINPGDKVHTFKTITKIVSALDPETLDIIADVYGQVISADIYKASSIKVAEAAKLVENTQRDLNIALMNELAIIFDHMNIDTQDVLAAARTKWNFLPFQPGLVGGHCIGVAPFYLTYKAKQLGYRPEVILAGRRINDGMGKYIADQTIKKMIKVGCHIKGAQVAILGLTFKENCPDVRYSRTMDVINELQTFGVELSVHDPLADKEEALNEYDIELKEWDEIGDIEAIVLCVSHEAYGEIAAKELHERYPHLKLITDVKGILDKTSFEQLGITVWRV